MKNFLALLAFVLPALFVKAQVVTTYPSFPTRDEPVTIYFHADKGDKKLMNFDSTIYIHSGVTTALGPWKYVFTTWGKVNAAWVMTKVSANLYSFQITPSIKSFYTVPVTDTNITDIDCVFRDANGAVKGADVGDADIFYPVFPVGQLAARFFVPTSSSSIILQLNQQSSVTFQSSVNSAMNIYDNGVLTANTFTGKDSVTFQYTATVPGAHIIKGVAVNGLQTAADSFTVIVPPVINYAALPAGSKIGVNYLSSDSVRLVLVAPHKKFVYVIGEFNNWQLTPAYYMNNTLDSVYWWIDIGGLTPGKEYAYQYDINGVMVVGDEYCDKVLDPNNDQYITAATYPGLRSYPTGANGIVSILQTNQTPYPWQVTNFTPPPTASMVIYELWVNDFVTAHNYSVLRDSVNYLKTLGVNAVELLPFNEFEGNVGLGYNSNYYFAPDKYYGPADSLKHFIDYCHQNGIAVIQDLAMNDCFGSTPYSQMYWDTLNNRPAANNPWLNAIPTHPYNVGSQFNHESPYTKKLFTDITRHWMADYKIDGFRFDLAKGYTQTNSGNDVGAWGNFDQSRINIWTGYKDSIKSVFPNAIMILEYFANNTESADLANEGLLLWNWGGSYSAYEQAAMGYPSPSWDLSDASYKALGGWNEPGQVNAMETHDQERVMYKVEQYGNASGSYMTKDTGTGLARISLCANLFFTIPGPDMIWEFEELGFDYSVNWQSNAQPTQGSNNDPKPIKWDYYQNPDRFRTFRVFASLIKLKETMPAFSTTNFTSYLSGPYKQVELISSTDVNFVAMGNFAVITGTYGATFPHTGTWYNYYDGSTFDATSDQINITLNAGEYRLYSDSKLPVPYLGLGLGVDNVNPEKSQIFEVYPNPADKNSSISFYVSDNEQATLAIYDLSGRFISTIFSQEHANKGYYSAPLGSMGLASGAYILRLTTSNGVSTQKLIVQ